MQVDAIIPAGGAGKRAGGDVSKQYVALGGIHMLAHTLRVFQEMVEIDRIVLLVPASDEEFVRTAIVEGYGLSKVDKVLAGGRERQDSVKNGLAALGPAGTDDALVIVHDAVRPFVTADLVLRAIDECRKHGAVTLGVPAKDTVKVVSDDGSIKNTLERKGLWLTQTPQVFKRKIILDAYRRAFAENFYGTDDAALVERLGIRVRMIPGSYENIKITTPEDLEYAEYLLGKKPVK